MTSAPSSSSTVTTSCILNGRATLLTSTTSRLDPSWCCRTSTTGGAAAAKVSTSASCEPAPLLVVIAADVEAPPLIPAKSCAELLFFCSSSTLSLSFLMYAAASSKLACWVNLSCTHSQPGSFFSFCNLNLHILNYSSIICTIENDFARKSNYPADIRKRFEIFHHLNAQVEIVLSFVDDLKEATFPNTKCPVGSQHLSSILPPFQIKVVLANFSYYAYRYKYISKCIKMKLEISKRLTIYKGVSSIISCEG